MSQARGQVPAGYREVLYWRLLEQVGGWRLVLLQLAILVVLLAILGVGMVWYALWHPAARELELPLWAWALGVGLMVVLHEGTHGLVMRGYGARPRFGVLTEHGLPVAFYTTAEGFAFPRTAYLRVTLAPALGLSALTLVALSFAPANGVAAVLILMLALNVAGSLGDAVIAFIVARYPEEAYVMDERDGMRIFMPQGEPLRAAAEFEA